MGKNQSEQSLARRNGANALRGGSSGDSSYPPTTTSTAVADTPCTATTTIEEKTDDAGRTTISSYGEVSVSIPIGQVIPGYISDRVDFRMTLAQREQLNRIEIGLRANGAKLANGVDVKTAAHALLWIIENTISG